MVDRYVTDPSSAASGEEPFAITPSDTVNFAYAVRGVYCGSTGDIVVIKESGGAVTFVGVQTGTILPVRAIRINSTNTTASSLVGLY